MIDAISLKAAIIDLAVSGKLSSDFCATDSATEIVSSLPPVSSKREKLLSQSFDYGKQFSIPEHWRWVPLGEISSYGDTPEKAYYSDVTSDTWILDLEDIKAGGEIIEKTRAEKKKFIGDKTVFKKGQILYSKLRPYLKKILVADEDGVSTPELIAFDTYGGILPQYIVYCLLSSYVDRAIDKRSYGVKMPRIDAGFMVNLPIPLPPISEQRFIVDRVEKVFSQISIIDTLQSQYQDNLATLKSKIIDAGIQGKLTEQLPEDGTAEDLYQQIQQERKKQEECGKIKKEDLFPDIEDQSIPFSVPNTWLWTYLGNVSYIVRGGSPRPIKQYITHDADGINWIKIGDVEKGGKYIYHTNERIIPEGEKKSRRVYPGDFLLTNSMSFGRPYISQIEGCIHDGWLLIRNLNGFDPDYLYYLLSSSYLYGQFTEKASGSTVDNLNIDKVKSAMIPLPPLAEQKRIVAKLEELLPLCEGK